MIVEKNTFNDQDGSLGWIECIYDSTNILSSIYFPKTKILYISFNRGMTYKYFNIEESLYYQFENSDSQGKFFVKNIKNDINLIYSKEFKLYESEIKDAKDKIKKWKQTKQ